MLSVDVRSNMQPFLADMRRTFADGIPTATYRALNKVAPQVRTAAIAGIRGTYKLSASTIRKSFSIRTANRNDLTASVVANGRPLPLYAFSAKQVKAGVSVNVKGTRKIVKGAYIATMPNGKIGVFTRQPGAKSKGKGKDRTALPIDQKFGVSIPLTMAGNAINDAMIKVVDSKFSGILIHEFERIAKQRGVM